MDEHNNQNQWPDSGKTEGIIPSGSSNPEDSGRMTGPSGRTTSQAGSRLTGFAIAAW